MGAFSGAISVNGNALSLSGHPSGKPRSFQFYRTNATRMPEFPLAVSRRGDLAYALQLYGHSAS